MAKTIGVMLKLKDGFSKGFENFRKETELTKRETKRLQNQVKGFGKDVKNAFTGFAKTGVTAVGTVGAALAGAGIKTGFAEAMDLQGYKQQLVTATKDTKKAAKIMTFAVNMANKTPYEAGELVSAAAMFESMGMSAKKWLPLTGDMAAATNKSVDQATEALIDAQTGELERMKEFGITKSMIADKANKMFANQQVVNNKGQIVDQEKFNQAMIALMQDKYAGGMEAQAKTIKGMWSTVTGVAKSGLATMVGMTADGSVRTGSAMDLIGQKVGWLAEKFEKWQTDGTIDRWAQTFDAGLKKAGAIATPIFKGIGSAVKFLADNFGTIAPLVSGIAVGFGALKAASKAAGAVKLLKVAFDMVNVSFKASPLFLIPTLFGVATSVLNAFGLSWGEIFTGAVDFVKQVWDKMTGWVDYMKNVKIPGWISSIKDWMASAKDNVQGLWDKFTGFIGWLKNVKLPDWMDSIGETASKVTGSSKKKKKSKHATGTAYFAGGATEINEGGRGETVILPSGTQIIPHDVAKRQQAAGGESNIVVHVNIAGNVIGNSDFANYVGRIVSKQVVKAVQHA